MVELVSEFDLLEQWQDPWFVRFTISPSASGIISSSEFMMELRIPGTEGE